MADLVIQIAGNICAGKSELVKYIGENGTFSPDKGISIVPEFVDPEALMLFYRDRKAYSEIFEDSCLTGRIVRHMKLKHEQAIHFIDRGIIEGAETFCQNSFQQGYLSHEAYQRYIDKIKRAFDQLDRTQQQSWLEQIVVYLRVKDPQVLQARKKLRGTKGENVPLDYLTRVNNLYEQLFNDVNHVYSMYGVHPPRVIEIDAETDFNHDRSYHKNIFDQVVKTVQQG